MILLSFLWACGGQEAQLQAEVSRLETEVAKLQAEIAGLRQSNQHLEMLDAASAAANEPIEERCSEVSPDVYVVAQPLLEAIQDRPEALVREGRWIPSATGGVHAWRAVHIRRGSLLASCGIRNGDVLHAVNGEAEPSAWLNVLEKAGDVEEAVLTLGRGQSKVRLEYRLD